MTQELLNVQGGSQSFIQNRQNAAFIAFAPADANQVLTAAQVTGGLASVDLQCTGVLGAGRSYQLPTAQAVDGVSPSTSYRLRVTNFQAGAFAITITTNTGWTLVGTMTIAQNTWREFIVTQTSGTTATLQAVATGTIS